MLGSAGGAGAWVREAGGEGGPALDPWTLAAQIANLGVICALLVVVLGMPLAVPPVGVVGEVVSRFLVFTFTFTS